MLNDFHQQITPRSPIPLFGMLWSFVACALIGACVSKSHRDHLREEIDQEFSDDAPARMDPEVIEALNEATPDDEHLFQLLASTGQVRHVKETKEAADPESAALMETEPSLKTDEFADTAGSLEEYWVFVTRAAVRPEPDPSAKRTRSIDYGEKVHGSPAGSGWVKLDDGGYVLKSALTRRQAKFDGKVVSGDDGTYMVTTTYLNVRSEPNRFSKSVAILPVGEKVRVLKEGWDGWSKIGEGRYLRSKHLKPGRAESVSAH